jgi:type II secretory pathway pseudopilin PulG
VRAEAGYNLVVLVIAVTVLNILVAAMLPLWSTAIRREKEEELVFRGFQYAEAIRVYHNRFQQYPNKLEDLIRVKPRCIRQLWKDPMTEHGQWTLIFQNQPRSINPQDPEGKPLPGDQEKPPGEGETEDGRPQLSPRKDETVQIGPIIGVHSRSGEKSMLVLFGKERYNEWHFIETLLLGGGQPVATGDPVGGSGAGVPTPAGALQFSTRWLGRPMRFMNQFPQMPQDGTMPDGQPGQKQTGKGGRRGSSNRP